MSIGTTRNLTSQFIKLRNDAKRARGAGAIISEDRATAKLLGAALDGAGDLELGSGIAASYTPSWVQKSERVKMEMMVLRERINKLKEYHGKALLVTFDNDNEVQSHTDAVTREIQLMFKRLDVEIRGMNKGGSADEDAGVRLQVQRQLAQALFKLTVEFRKEETRFLNKIEAQKGLEQGSSIGLVEDDAPGPSGMTDAGFTEAQLMKVSQAEAQIEERDEEIRKVVETIAELAQIMRDLSTLVVEQGTILDRIDHNVTEVAMKVEQGVKELVKAEQTQKKGRALLCIMALCVLIVLMLIVVVVRHAGGFIG